jgi:hypothetical protein
MTAVAAVHAIDTSESRGFSRAAGVGGFVFLASVLIENVLRAPPPSPGAPLSEVARYYTERGSALSLSQAFYATAIPGLLLFAVGTMRRVRRDAPAADPWAWVGAIGVCMMTATFGTIMALDAVLTSSAKLLAAGSDAALLAWKLKNAMFFVNVVALCTGFGAFGMACRIAKFGPRWLATAAVISSLVGLASVMPLRANIEGLPVGMLGLFPFLCWIAFLAVTSTNHLRAR